MPVVLPADVERLQAAIRAQRDSIQFVIGTCPAAKADVVLIAQWDAFDVVVSGYLSADPSWWDTAKQMDTGEAIQAQLSAWQDRIAAKGCSNLPPKPPPPPESGLQQATSLVTHVVEGAVVLGGLWLVLQLARRRKG